MSEYTTTVYHQQGGDTIVVDSGGSITVLSGGTLSVAAGGTFTGALTGSLTGNVVGNLTGNSTGAHSGNVSTSSITFATGAPDEPAIAIDGLHVKFVNLPTTDPGAAGALWNNAGVLTISDG
jgi:hypothetical protein